LLLALELELVSMLEPEVSTERAWSQPERQVSEPAARSQGSEALLEPKELAWSMLSPHEQCRPPFQLGPSVHPDGLETW
jgi:hypothetical protein